MFTMIAYQRSTNHIGSIHRTGCKDITKDANEHAGVVTELDSATLAEALATYIDAEMEDMGYSTDDVRVLPCAK
jgi:hypothetical protein